MADEAERAYRAAVKLIEKVRKAGGTEISFFETRFRALTRIPVEIAQIKGLTKVDLDKTQISDLSPLGALRGLEVLSLNQTQVADLSPLAALTGLRGLYLNQTQVADLSPLAALTGLQELYLNQTSVSDLTPLAALTGLRGLWLSQTRVADLSPLAALTGLRELWLSQTPVADLSTIADLTGLERLSLNQMPVADLSPLAALTGLQELSLTQTQVSDLSPLAALTGLQWLYLTQTLVADLSPLAALTGLQRLWLTQTQVADLRPIKDLPLDAEGLFGGLWFDDTPATKADPELARLAEIEDDKTRTTETLAYLKTLPPWPEPLPWLEPPAQRTGQTSQGAKGVGFAPSPIPGRGLVVPAGLKRLTLKDARSLLAENHPVLRGRCQAVVGMIDDALAMQSVRIPNDPERLAEHLALSDTLTLAKAAMMGIHDAIPEGLTDQPIDDATAGALRAAFDAAIEKLKSAATYVDRKDHTPTYGGLLKLGAATGVASVLAMVPGVNLVLAIPAVYACLYGVDAAKTLKLSGSSGG